MSLLKVESKRTPSSPSTGFNTSAGFWAAIIISLCVHFVVLYHWSGDRSTHISLGQTQFSALIVTPDTGINRVEKHRAKEKHVANNKTAPIIKSVSRQLAATEKTTVQQPAGTLQQQTQQSQNAVRGNIQSNLSQYLSYPEFARRKGWQGIVVVTLKVNESGHFKDIRVNSSSGFDILDNTALDALHKLNAIEIQQEFKLALNTLLEIPIHFKLQGS